MSAELVTVHLRGIPVPLWARTQEHTDELLREFLLIANDREREGAGHDVPGRLTALIDELTQQYGGFSGANEQRLADAAVAGKATIDLDYELPPDAAQAAAHLGDLLDDADDYCRRGQHLLTLATPDELVRFRRWFLAEFERQVAGEPPIPWSDYAG
jgi:hypothetical protein